MNIRLLGSGEWHRFKIDCLGDQYTEENVARADAEWKKTKSFICASSYWTVQYGLAASALKNDAEFEPKSDSKADIKRAFSQVSQRKEDEQEDLIFLHRTDCIVPIKLVSHHILQSPI